MQLPNVGDIFEGKYEILGVLGRGGFAAVYRARDLEIGRDVAIKVLVPDHKLGYRADVAKRFMREARVVAGLHHPATITMFEFGRAEGGTLFMVFEFVDGVPLNSLIKPNRAFGLGPTVRVLVALLGALGEAHENGVIHRDVKPGNILLFDYMGDPYCAKLLDFGIAKPLVDPSAQASNLTREGMVVGTPRYMAPEQFFGEAVSAATDIYCLGLVAHELLTGRHPFDVEQPQAIAALQLKDDVKIGAEHGTPALRAVLERMTRTKPEDRYASAGAVLEALESASDLAPVVEFARPDDQLETAPRTPLPRRRASQPEPGDAPVGERLAVGVLIGLAISGAIGVAVMSALSEEDDTVDLPSQLTHAPARAELHSNPTPPHRTAESEAGSTDVGLADVRRSDGCGIEQRGAKLRGFSVDLDFGPRGWVSYAPRGYDPNHRHPIVLMFHRNSRDARDMVASTAIAELANAHRFLAVALDANAGPKPWTHADDAALVLAAIDETRREYCVDETRIYGLGDGGGGRFARNLPCTVKLSAIATTASGQYPHEPVCQVATPMIRLFGELDRDVPASGGPGCMGGASFMSNTEIEDSWRTRNGCGKKSRSWLRHRNGHCRAFSCDAAFVSCAMKGGHDWPTAPPPLFKMPNCQAAPPDFPIGETIWRFFEEEGRPLVAQPR